MHWAQALVFCGCLMGASIYDVRHRLVDDRVCVALVLAGLITISPASFSYKNHKLCLWANIARALIRKKRTSFC